jgi:IclR family transcriptional regulator, acetate operon repressor
VTLDRPGGGERRSHTSRIFRVINAFTGPADVVSPAALVKRTGLPKSTVHRILNDLVGVRMLERTGGGVCLGVQAFELGTLVPANRRMREVALPFMEDLYEATHEIVHLGILDGSDVLYLVKLSGHERVPLPTRDGARMPAHATGLGKALLAAAPHAAVRRLLARPLRKMTAHTIVDPQVLLGELAEVARTGVAFDREEAFDGVVCVAAPITLRRFPDLAAISVTGPPGRLDIDHVAAAVRVAAFAISRNLDHARDGS